MPELERIYDTWRKLYRTQRRMGEPFLAALFGALSDAAWCVETRRRYDHT